MSRRLKGGVTGMKRGREENSDNKDIKRTRMAADPISMQAAEPISMQTDDTLGDFIRDYGNEIDKLQDNNLPKWDKVSKSWVGNGDMDYGYTKINEYINTTPQILNDIRRIITTTNDFTNFTDKNDSITRNDNRHSDTYSKTFGDIVVVMGLYSEQIRNLLKNLAEAKNTKDNVKSMLETQSMVIKIDKKGEEIKTFKYPLDNLFTLGDAAGSYYCFKDADGDTDDCRADLANANKKWCIWLNSYPPTTGKKFYDETNMKSVYDDFMQIAKNMKFVRQEGNSYFLIDDAGEPCKKIYKFAEPLFKDDANGIFRKTCT